MFLAAAVVINITTIDAPKRIASAIVKDCPDSTQDRSGADKLAVVGRPIFSTHHAATRAIHYTYNLTRRCADLESADRASAKVRAAFVDWLTMEIER
jgi:hypothetical protein